MPAIVAENLVRTFGDFTAVNKVNFQVEKGEVFGFLGPNGSGKTTVIKMLTGILPLTSGRGIVDGIDVTLDPDGVRNRIGYMSQKFSLYDDLTVLENLRFYGKIYNIEPRRLQDKIDQVISQNALEPYVDRLALRLSVSHLDAPCCTSQKFFILMSLLPVLTPLPVESYGTCSSTFPDRASHSSSPHITWTKPSAAAISPTSITAT